MNELEKFEEALHKMKWPTIYPFKFIVPLDQLIALNEVLSSIETTTKFSKKGNYASVSAKPLMMNPEKVMDVYKKVANIPGIISL